MSLQEANKAIVGRWFTEFWGNPWNPDVVDELAAPEIRFEYSLHQPLRGRAAVKEFATNFGQHSPISISGALRISSRRAITSSGSGRAAEPTPAPNSTTFPLGRYLPVPESPCASAELPCCGSRMVSSPKKWASTTA
jgi:hypothetical protein